MTNDQKGEKPPISRHTVIEGNRDLDEPTDTAKKIREKHDADAIKKDVVSGHTEIEGNRDLDEPTDTAKDIRKSHEP
jgi:hypothetical protein